MKETGLLELRDQLLIHSLKLPLTKEGAFAIMQGFSFEWVAEKQAFREANGLAHLLHLFHSFPGRLRPLPLSRIPGLLPFPVPLVLSEKTRYGLHI